MANRHMPTSINKLKNKKNPVSLLMGPDEPIDEACRAHRHAAAAALQIHMRHRRSLELNGHEPHRCRCSDPDGHEHRRRRHGRPWASVATCEHGRSWTPRTAFTARGERSCARPLSTAEREREREMDGTSGGCCAAGVWGGGCWRPIIYARVW